MSRDSDAPSPATSAAADASLGKSAPADGSITSAFGEPVSLPSHSRDDLSRWAAASGMLDPDLDPELDPVDDADAAPSSDPVPPAVADAKPIQAKTQVPTPPEPAKDPPKPPPKAAAPKWRKKKPVSYRLPPTPTSVFSPPPAPLQTHRVGSGTVKIVIDVNSPAINKIVEVMLEGPIKSQRVEVLSEMMFEHAVLERDKHVPIFYSPHFPTSLKKEKTLKFYRIKDGTHLSCSVMMR